MASEKKTLKNLVCVLASGNYYLGRRDPGISGTEAVLLSKPIQLFVGAQPTRNGLQIQTLPAPPFPYREVPDQMLVHFVTLITDVSEDPDLIGMYEQMTSVVPSGRLVIPPPGTRVN